MRRFSVPSVVLRFDPNRSNGELEPATGQSETLVHFHKSFGVMQDIFDHRDFVTLREELLKNAADATPGMTPVPQFLDLGCAPGGFSACLLQDSILGSHSVGSGEARGRLWMTGPERTLISWCQDMCTCW